MAFVAPLSTTVAAFPPVPLIVPETLKLGAATDVKFTAVTLPLLTVAFWLTGVKVNPALLGVTV